MLFPQISQGWNLQWGWRVEAHWENDDAFESKYWVVFTLLPGHFGVWLIGFAHVIVAYLVIDRIANIFVGGSVGVASTIILKE